MVSLFKKFAAAFSGLVSACKDKSIQIQLVFAVCVLIFGWIYGFNGEEWLWIISCIFIVVLCEMVNTAIERLCDLVDLRINPKIKYIKDLSAGCVLLASFYAVVIGCMILKGVLR